MANVANGVETLPKISIAWVWRTDVTARRQTDGRWHNYSERECKFTFAKNGTIVSLFVWTQRSVTEWQTDQQTDGRTESL